MTRPRGKLGSLAGLGSRGHLLGAAGATVTAAALVAVAPFLAGTASATTRPTQAVQVRPPSNAMPGSSAFLSGVTCVSTGSCAASGTFIDSAGDDQAMVAVSTGGRWARAIGLQMPANANPNPFASARSVSCAKVGSCVVVGSYGSTTIQGYVATESHGTWGRARHLSPPSNSTANIFQLSAVSCTGAGSCVAVGNYQDSSGDTEGMVVTESNGKWGQARELKMPANASANPSVTVPTLSCARTGDCVAGAQYVTTSDAFEPALVTESGGTWRRAAQVLLPHGAATSPDSGIDSVACATVGSCIALGQYIDQHSAQLSFTVIESGGTWARGREFTAAPTNAAANPQVALRSVSCPKSEPCIVLGGYLNHEGGNAALVALRQHGMWTGTAQLKPPANAQQGAALNTLGGSVSCSSAGYCAVVSAYMTTAGHWGAMATG